jgi:hypothetical protein
MREDEETEKDCEASLSLPLDITLQVPRHLRRPALPTVVGPPARLADGPEMAVVSCGRYFIEATKVTTNRSLPSSIPSANSVPLLAGCSRALNPSEAHTSSLNDSVALLLIVEAGTLRGGRPSHSGEPGVPVTQRLPHVVHISPGILLSWTHHHRTTMTATAMPGLRWMGILYIFLPASHFQTMSKVGALPGAEVRYPPAQQRGSDAVGRIALFARSRYLIH